MLPDRAEFRPTQPAHEVSAVDTRNVVENSHSYSRELGHLRLQAIKAVLPLALAVSALAIVACGGRGEDQYEGRLNVQEDCMLITPVSTPDRYTEYCPLKITLEVRSGEPLLLEGDVIPKFTENTQKEL